MIFWVTCISTELITVSQFATQRFDLNGVYSVSLYTFSIGTLSIQNNWCADPRPDCISLALLYLCFPQRTQLLEYRNQRLVCLSQERHIWPSQLPVCWQSKDPGSVVSIKLSVSVLNGVMNCQHRKSNDTLSSEIGI